MAQRKEISFPTTSISINTELNFNSFKEFNYINDDNLTSQIEENPKIFNTQIELETVKIQDSVLIKEGDLRISIDINKANVSVDVNGNLIILQDKPNLFSINNNGELEYTFQ